MLYCDEADDARRCGRATQTRLNFVSLQMSTGQMSEDERKMAQQKAMQDPEIQLILTDPIMRQVRQASASAYPSDCRPMGFVAARQVLVARHGCTSLRSPGVRLSLACRADMKDA